MAYASVDGLADAYGWLDRLRRTVYATEAVLWHISDARLAVPVLHAGGSSRGSGSGIAASDIRRTTAERLQRLGLVVCGIGEVSGIDDFVPPGMTSFVVAGANRTGRLANVLVLGWTAPLPSCGVRPFDQLRVAAALLDRALSDPSGLSLGSVTADPVIRAMDAGIAVLDSQGAVMAATAARTGLRGPSGDAPTAGTRVSSLDLCRRAAAAGSADASAAAHGIATVASGASHFFQAACLLPESDGDRWTLFTATPLQPAGGAVVLHCDLLEPTIEALTQRFGDRRLVQIVEALPLALWIAGRDGRVICASRQWDESVEGATSSSRPRHWLDGVHPDDRQAAGEAFADAVARRERMNIDVRLRSADGTYRWFSCAAAPIASVGHEAGGYVGVCIDTSSARQVQASRDLLASKLLAAQEAERARCARDLHDDLGHQVVLLDAQLETAMRQRWTRTHSMATLRGARSKLQEIGASVHALAHRLHPAKLRLLGLQATLQALCRDIGIEADKEVTFEASSVPDAISEAVAVSLFRITQEALQNAVKHSGARAITVRLTGAGDTLRLRIDDDGGGFDPLTVPSAGLGLMTMRERVELLGGTLSIATAPARGTSIEIAVSSKERDAQ